MYNLCIGNLAFWEFTIDFHMGLHKCVTHLGSYFLRFSSVIQKLKQKIIKNDGVILGFYFDGNLVDPGLSGHCLHLDDVRLRLNVDIT